MKPKRRKPTNELLFRLTRPLRDRLVVPCLELICFIAGRLSHSAALAVGRLLGRIAWLLAGRRRSLAQRQLLEAGLYATKAEARRAARQVFEHLGQNMMEGMHSRTWTSEQYLRQVDLINTGIVPPASQGLIFLTGHFGNWELLPPTWFAFAQRPMAIIMTEQRNQRLNEWLVNRRQASGSKLLSSNAAAIGMLRHIIKGGILGLLGDQDSTRVRGIFANFFGRPAYSPVGPATLSRKTGAWIVPVMIHRCHDDPRRHVIEFQEPIKPDFSLTEDEDLRRMTQRFNDLLEQEIRQYPTQWVWIHDRWRHRPGKKIRVRGVKKSKKEKPER